MLQCRQNRYEIGLDITLKSLHMYKISSEDVNVFWLKAATSNASLEDCCIQMKKLETLKLGTQVFLQHCPTWRSTEA